MARTLDGVDDRIRCSPGALSNYTFGTVLLVMRRDSTAWNGLVVGHDGGGTSLWGLELGPSAGVDNRLFYLSNGNSSKSTFTLTNADGYVLAGGGKATGTAAPRMHKYVYSTNTWTHEDGDTALANNTGTTAVVALGDWELSDFLAGDIAVAAVWKRQLTDAEVEALAHSLTAWYASAPDALWVADQVATSMAVPDLTGGGANQSSITGTTVAATSAPLGYGFEVGVPQSVAAAGSTVSLTTAELAFAAEPVSPVPGMVSVTLTPATITLAAEPADPDPGPVTVALSTATMPLSAPALDPDPGPVTVVLSPAALTFAALAVDADPGVVTVALSSAVLSLAAVAATATPGPVSVAVAAAELAFAAQPLTPSASGTVTLTPAGLTVSAVPLAPAPGPVAMTLTPAVLAFAAVALAVGATGAGAPPIVTFTAPRRLTTQTGGRR